MPVAAIETVRQQAASKGLEIRHELPPEPVVIEADAERLAQVLDNLLRNAVTYTEAGTITVSVQSGNAHASISVRDTGIGIQPDVAPTLFKPYQQRGDGGRSGGLGLGLTLVKGLVEAHGGAVEVHSEGHGKGSVFSVTIPLTAGARAGTSGAAAPGPPPELPAARSVLVVDDQHDIADMFGALLEHLGQDVTVAYRGEDAVALAYERRPQVAFLDVSMPGMSGADVARRLRNTFPPDALALVAVTGHGQAHAGVQDGEFDHYLLKPVTLERVLALLHELPARR